MYLCRPTLPSNQENCLYLAAVKRALAGSTGINSSGGLAKNQIAHRGGRIRSADTKEPAQMFGEQRRRLENRWSLRDGPREVDDPYPIHPDPVEAKAA
ncbi:uncharacterized protein [Dermacentor andersoni]|uniref:uncharacterized protein isoform X2 n=1 Tax=Dermacentor andersoni TaxID=34620 RepID=UPI003B3BBBBE